MNKQRSILFILTLIGCMSVCAESKRADYQAYISKWSQTALTEQKAHKIPAYITIAQGLLESGAGKSSLATQANNHFGIKCHEWQGPTFRLDDDRPNECFRKYEHANESFADHSLFLQKSRYTPLFKLDLGDYKGWAKGLSKCGYATDPQYANKLIKIIEDYDLLSLMDKGIVIRNSDGESVEVMALPQQMANKHIPGLPLYPVITKHKHQSRYVVAREGDTFERIAFLANMNVKILRKYNNATDGRAPKAGERIFFFRHKTVSTKS